LIAILISSCSSLLPHLKNEPITDQQNLLSFLEDIVNSQEDFSVEALNRRAFNPLIKQTKLLTHSYYLINLNDEKYLTLSFSNKKFIFLYSDGIWVINKKTDISSHKLFIKGNNPWKVNYLFAENTIDERQTLKNIINSLEHDMKFYYRDHLKSKPNSFNCNSAIFETVMFKQQ